MSTRNRGKQLAGGITAAVAVGSLATAGVAAAAIYSSTPSVLSKTGSTTSTAPGGTSAPDGTSSTGPRSSSGSSSGTQDNSGRRPRGFTGTSPVQPGNGNVTHGRSSGS
ncbi:hypothetical protein [Pseudarthrobacter sulfonivorans]|uniref:hypothetical protein n=1 Tax=Pseudarthrobacter sulfonivorans TaxID=121292 RepID=UPI002107F2C1|nr:hypothetical protein [Pseudarthrobacter sulfonivorans]